MASESIAHEAIDSAPIRAQGIIVLLLNIIITKEQELLKQHGDWEVPCKRREKIYSKLNVNLRLQSGYYSNTYKLPTSLKKNQKRP